MGLHRRNGRDWSCASMGYGKRPWFVYRTNPDGTMQLFPSSGKPRRFENKTSAMDFANGLNLIADRPTSGDTHGN